MRTSTLAAGFVMLCAIATPSLADSEPTPQVQVQAESRRQAATKDELASYAKRELAAKEQQKFEGGRIRNSDLVTVILVLVIVVLVLAII